MRIYIFLYFLVLISVSCSTSRKVVKVEKVGIETILLGMKKNERSYSWFSAKARVKFEGEEMRLSGRCNIRMIKDSLIWMNFKKLSIEGSRILITKDSFWIVYRLDKLYESGTLRELMEAYDLDLSFEELQNFVIGNFPIPEKNEIRNFKSDVFHELSFQNENTTYNYNLRGDFTLAGIFLHDSHDRKIFGEFDEYNSNGIAEKKEFRVEMGEGGQAKISFKFTSIEIDIPKSIKFEIPDHYTRLP